MLHSFYLVTTGLMLLWYLRYELWGSRGIAEAATSKLEGRRNEPQVELSRQTYVARREYAPIG